MCVHEHGNGFILGELLRDELSGRVENEGRSGEINCKDSREEQEWLTQGTFSKETSNKRLLMTAQQQKAVPHEPGILCLRGILQTTEAFVLIEYGFCILLKSTFPCCGFDT